MRARVTFADPAEVLEVEHDARDRRAAEVRFGSVVKAPRQATIRQLMEAHPETWICWVCWHAATRQGATSMTWEQWSARALETEDADPAAEPEPLPDPTGPGTSPG